MLLVFGGDGRSIFASHKQSDFDNIRKVSIQLLPHEKGVPSENITSLTCETKGCARLQLRDIQTFLPIFQKEEVI